MATSHAGVQTVIGTSLSTTTATQIFATLPWATCQIVIANSTNENISLATGSSGNEVDVVAVAPNSTFQFNIQSGQYPPTTTRLSLFAQGTAPTSGYVTVSVVP